MKQSVQLLTFLLLLLLPSVIAAQVWRWAKKDLVIEGINTSPVKSCIDSRGNTILLSLKLDRQILTKHDQDGALLWKRELFLITGGSSNLTDICVDSSDNIYAGIAALSKIDNTPVNTPAPYGFLKFNTSGRYLWGRTINYTPGIFSPQLRCSRNKIYMALQIRPFESLTYNGTLYTNAGGNTYCTFLAALDTTGTVTWYKRLYSPPQPLTCTPRDVYPSMSVNEAQDLFMTGSATDKLMAETTPLIDYPYTCKHFIYGLLLNGNNGQVKWVRELRLDTLVQRPNTLMIERRILPVALSNGYALVYKCTTQDSLVSSFVFKTVGLSNTMNLYDLAGNLIRKDTVGRVETGWNEILQLAAGEETNSFSAGWHIGPYDGIKTFESIKWDTLLSPLWKKQTEYALLTPFFSSRHLYYRNKQLNLMLQSGNESHNMNYAYFGADSLLPYRDNLFARMDDASNYISGSVFIDQNLNGIKEITEPPAPGVLISDNTGTTVYAVTNNAGYFEFAAAPGTYIIKPLNNAITNPYHTNLSPANYSVTVTGYGNYVRNKSFALRGSASINDGQINIAAFTIARPGGSFVIKAQASNPGSDLFSGSYSITYDSSRLVYTGSLQTPATVIPPVVSYNITGLSPSASIGNEIFFTVKTTAVASDTLKFKAQLSTTPADRFLINNNDSLYRLVRSSYDPNEKEVYPFKDVKYDSVTAGKQELDYIIHFQNTGNDTAFTVLITDTLDSKLDISTFHLVMASHPVSVQWKGPFIAGFYFADIHLPDSTTNRVKSNGFVRYKIKPKTNVLLSDSVRNKAGIYFDYNSPVITNTVVTNFITGIVTGLFGPQPNQHLLKVWPMPAKGQLHFRILQPFAPTAANIQLFDTGGRLVFSKTERIASEQVKTLAISRFAPGIYFLVIKRSHDILIQKITLQ